ncbi:MULTISPECIES: zinc finger, SWIM-type [Paraburkholderia]|uniref:zinc finger, SWIM-type n=1 Tax=Paraburkholderia TaxID=1822464 RepID=UPI000362E71D|nr:MULTISPECIES: zinc finger, SWIM-type [Paraburkholderia]MDH6147315.1 putative Zn finger protein [Paraburkholderia sp. WSM4179]
MGYGYGGWKPYVSVAERRKKAERAAAKARKAGAVLSPIASYRGAIARTFWGKAWCDNLEGYSDYANRLPRGRTYVRNGSVIDLQITAGEVRAQVMGSSLYTVGVSVTACPAKQWRTIGADCSGSIDSMVELLQGKFSTAVMERICRPGTGLFPVPKEIRFNCSCPDWASMCKHVAAVLYGVGARLDQQPELLFALRRVNANDLVRQASAGLPKSTKRPATSKVLDDALVADVFGIEMADAYSPPKPVAGRNKPPAGKVTARKATRSAVSTARRPPANAKTAEDNKSVTKKLPVKPSAGPRKSTSGNIVAGKANVANSPATPKEAATRKRAITRPVKDTSR